MDFVAVLTTLSVEIILDFGTIIIVIVPNHPSMTDHFSNVKGKVVGLLISISSTKMAEEAVICLIF